ncbi:hypothetical protein [Nostoc sp.]
MSSQLLLLFEGTKIRRKLTLSTQLNVTLGGYEFLMKILFLIDLQVLRSI